LNVYHVFVGVDRVQTAVLYAIDLSETVLHQISSNETVYVFAVHCA
jgi:hypothetical protein